MSHLIKEYEGFRQTAYKCPAGVWTIGYGSTKKLDCTPIKEGDTITKYQAEELLNNYVIKNIEPVIEKIPYELTISQQEAIKSLCYNIGTSAFLKSNLFKAICNKDVEGIFKNWDWIKAGGKVQKGLVKRRSHEMFLFIHDM